MPKVVLFLFAVVAIIVWAEVVKSPEADKVDGIELYFFDVGQGDSVLIQKDDFQIMIDGGPSDTVLSKLGEVMPIMDRNIEVIILTHPHADHLVGINQVLERYDVGTIYSTGASHTSNEYLEFLENVKNKSVNYLIPNIEDKISHENIDIEFLWPGERYKEKSLENLNNTSLVMRACYFDHCTLFMGDLELDGQRLMFAETGEKSIESEILKVSHHGSHNGTDKRLLDKIMPKYAVIEVGLDNKFDHPHDITLDLLKDNEIEILRTDEGDVEFIISEFGVDLVE